MLNWTHLHYGVVLGRFQPLHVGHIEYLEAARARCDRLVIGVTNPHIEELVDDATDLRRSRPENNPFSYLDRAEMIGTSLLELGWGWGDFVLVPADVNRPRLLRNFLPSPTTATVFITVYDDWGDRKADVMRDLGYPVDVLWRRSMDERVTSGSELRQAMRSGGRWRHLVPDAVARYLDESGAIAAVSNDLTSSLQP